MIASRKPVVALLAAPETTASVLYGLFDVLLSVGAVYPDMTVGDAGDAMLDVKIVSKHREPFRCFGNVLVEPHAAIADIDRPDVAIVCDMYSPIHSAPHGRYGAEIDWLRHVYADGALVGSVCSGSLLLAEAGLLEERECATHWAYRDLFKRNYPKVHLRPESVLNLSCASDRIVTAGGVTAWQDLALYIIIRLCGRQHAIQTAKVYLLAGHEDGQLPFAALNRHKQGTDAIISECQAWIAHNYAEANPVGRMADHSGLQPRTFARRFRIATGYLPMEYVHALRIEEAKQVIETEDGDLDEIGFRVGYQDPTFFRRLFKRLVGVTPAAYRRKINGIGAATDAVPAAQA